MNINVGDSLFKNIYGLRNFQQKIHKMTKGRIIFSLPPSPPFPFVNFTPIRSKLNFFLNNFLLDFSKIKLQLGCFTINY